MITVTYEVREKLQDLLGSADISGQANLVAMHLTEIEEDHELDIGKND